MYVKVHEGVRWCMKVHERLHRPSYCSGHRYSETGCSFARHFAILSRNVGTKYFDWQFFSEQVAIQISICCLRKRFFLLEYCELTAMASNITTVSKREKVIFLWSSGYRNQKLCSRLHFSHQTVSNILSNFLQNGTAAP